MKDTSVYLRHILDAIAAIESFTSSGERDAKTFSAVERQLEIIGEAANKLPNTFCANYSAIPWKDIIGMRRILIHEYFGVQPSMVWKVVEHDLQPLKQAIEDILRTLEENS